LEGILGVVRIEKHASANPQYHWTVPLNEDGKSQLGCLAVAADEAFQKLAVAEVPDRSHAIERANLAEHTAGCCTGHGYDPP
jgi:hypothetical protein